jgi:hypothetical protein
MDYNRQYLGNPDVAAMGTEEQRASLPGEVAGNAKRTGAGLGDQRGAFLAKENALDTQIAPGFSVRDFLSQPGNLFDLEKQRAAAYDSGDKKRGYELSLAINDVIGRIGAQHPEVRAYLDTLKNGGVTSPASTTAPSPSTSSQSANGDSSNTGRNTGSPAGGQSYSPRSSSNRSGTGGGSGSASRQGSGSPASNTNTRQAGNDFFDFYKGITDRREKAAVLDALDRAGIGMDALTGKGVGAEQYRRALAVARDALYTKRAADILDSAGSTQHSGMTRAQAEYAIAQMDRQAGIPQAAARTSAPATKKTYAVPYPGKKKAA